MVDPKGSRAYPTISFDLCYTGYGAENQLEGAPAADGSDKDKLTCLVSHCSHTGSIFALPLPDKSGNSMRSAACELVRFCQLLGHTEVELMCDQEPSVLQLQILIMAARKRLGFRTRIRNPGIDEHQQNGNAEKSIDVIRNLANVLLSQARAKFALRIRNPGIDEHQQNGNAEKSIDVIRNLANVLLSQARAKFALALPVSHPLVSWAWVQASWLYNRFHVKAGLTAHERASGCRYNGRLLPFAEPCWAYVRPSQKGSPRWAMSIFLTKSCVNDMYVVATPRGVQLTRSVRRTGQPWASEKSLAENIKGVPWDYHLGTIGTKMVPQARHRAPNAVPVLDAPSEVMPPPGLQASSAPSAAPGPSRTAVPPAQAEERSVPVMLPPSVASAAPSSRPTLLLDRGDRRPVAASPMEIAGTDPPTTPGTSIDYSPSPASPPVLLPSSPHTLHLLLQLL
eukprot:s9144_g3.t1